MSHHGKLRGEGNRLHYIPLGYKPGTDQQRQQHERRQKTDGSSARAEARTRRRAARTAHDVEQEPTTPRQDTAFQWI